MPRFCKECHVESEHKVCVCGSRRFTNNEYGVPRAIWSEFSESAKKVFAMVYKQGLTQRLFLHPKTEKVSDEQWKTTAFNFGIVAGEAVDGFEFNVEE